MTAKGVTLDTEKYMANQPQFTQSRRKFLKGAVSASALSIAGLSGLAIADTSILTVDALSGASVADEQALASSGIRIIQETMLDREKVTLINQSGKLQMVDAREPISLYRGNGKLMVKVNQDDAKAVNGMIVMSPDQRLTFDVSLPAPANLVANQLQISSNHSVFNRVVPVQAA